MTLKIERIGAPLVARGGSYGESEPSVPQSPPKEHLLLELPRRQQTSQAGAVSFFLSEISHIYLIRQAFSVFH